MSNVYGHVSQMPLSHKETELIQALKDRLSSPDSYPLASNSAFWHLMQHSKRMYAAIIE